MVMKMEICKNIIFESQRWFTFGEVVQRCSIQPTESDVYSLAPYEDVDELSDLDLFLGTACKSCFTKTDTTEKAIVDKLIAQIYARFYDHYVFFTQDQIVENGAYTREYNDRYVLLRSRFTSTFVLTEDKYLYLLKTYKNQLSTLLDKVKTKSTGVGKFNDTPQNEIVNGDEFGDNGHISNLTKSENETETDFDTKMGRIDEIQRKFRNLLKDWSDEFSGLFVESENI